MHVIISKNDKREVFYGTLKRIIKERFESTAARFEEKGNGPMKKMI